ncbi:hypothetical protein Mapa_014225 [Marchantia paleacea]|nr:hypothetical protein Mapa_014225 [Marchantia paleacea]
MADRVYPEKNVVSGAPPHGAYYNLKDETAAPVPVPEDFDGREAKRRDPCCRCAAWFCGALVALIFAVGIAVLVFFLVVHPKAPKYNVKDVKLATFSVSPSSSDPSKYVLNALTLYEVEARNPNQKIGIYYDAINIDVLSEGVSIGAGDIPSFYQGHKNTTVITGDLSASDVPLESTVGQALQSAQSVGRIPLYVTVDVRARIKIGAWKSPHFWVHVRCNVAVNPDVANGSQVVSKQCEVKR